ncbi:hypothetical protein GCM10023320_50010 [Pseudonocardia adelaidensis]|uniref:Uncharacterized protein n=1 Tax=Pseudonocardia adelaidensis TaxID=648754 RepID=A0ABP9NP31_9PSEU
MHLTRFEINPRRRTARELLASPQRHARDRGEDGADEAGGCASPIAGHAQLGIGAILTVAAAGWVAGLGCAPGDGRSLGPCALSDGRR